MADKNYLGLGWEKVFNNGGSVINLSLKLEDLQDLPVNEYGDIKIVVARRKEPDAKTRSTHLVYEDTYVRGQSKKSDTPKPAPEEDPF